MSELVLTYYSLVKDGKIDKAVSQKIAAELHHWERQKIQIKIEKLKSKRSIAQNKYYWQLCTILGNELGYKKEEMHNIIKYKFLKREGVFEETGEVYNYLKSTTELGKADFANFTSDIIQWASETFSIALPLPGEQLDLEI